MSIVNALGGFGWEGYGTSQGYCMVADSADIFQGTEEVLSTWQISNKGAGYDPVCDCYCWGYMPPPISIIGLGTVYNNAKWRICDSRYASRQVCCEGAGGAGDCPPCPPASAPPKTITAAQQLGGKYGITLGWLLAAGIVGGGGYYAYKKGDFKRKGRRKRK